MSCETRQEQASLLIDAELPESEQVALFRHLEECGECRRFLDSMIRFRQAARRDQEAILLAAEDILPQGTPFEWRKRPVEAGFWQRLAAGGWRVPAPVAVSLAAILLLGGALLGSRVARVAAPGGEIRPAVVVVCGLPPVDVVGTSP